MAPAPSKLPASTPTKACALSPLDNGPTDVKDTTSSSSSPTSSSGTTAATSITDQATALAALADQGQPAPVFRQGAPRNPPFCIATQTTPLWHLLTDLNEPFAIDIVFQNWSKDGVQSHRLGRVAVTNLLGQVILDTFVFYRNEKHLGVQKFLPGEWRNLGVTYEDLKKDNGAQPAERVEAWLVRILTGRPVILHGGANDKKAFYIHKDFLRNHPQVIDTQELYAYEVDNNFQPGLRACAAAKLGRAIQVDNHSPVEDAQAAMDLYLLKHPYPSTAAPVAAPVPVVTTQPSPAPAPAPVVVNTWARIAASASNLPVSAHPKAPTTTTQTQPPTTSTPTPGQTAQRGGRGGSRGRGGRGGGFRGRGK